MKNRSCLLFFALISLTLFSEGLPRVQVGPILAGVPVLKPHQSRLPVFSVTWANNQISNDGRYQIPDVGVAYNGPAECYFMASTQTSASMDEYRSSEAQNAAVSWSFSKFVGALSDAYQQASQEIIANNNVASQSVSKCTMYQLLVQPGLTPLDPYFQKRALGLPVEYTPDNSNLFFYFLDDFGTHFVEEAHLGGKLKQMAFTADSYYGYAGSKNVSIQAQATFNFGITGNYSEQSIVSDAYRSSTQTDSIESIGGQVWKNGSTWYEWANNVKALPNFRVRARLVSLSRLFLTSGIPELESRSKALDKAIMDYITRKGCTDPRALNYNRSATVNDTSCIFNNYPSFCPSCSIRNGGSGQTCSVSGETCQKLGQAENCYTGYNGAVECYCGMPHPPELNSKRQLKAHASDFPAGPHAYCGDQSNIIDPSRQCCTANNPKNYDGNCAVCCSEDTIPQCSIMGKLATCNCVPS